MRYLIFPILLICILIISFDAKAHDKPSVYERVIKSGTIRCGYIPYPPALIVDPNTGKLSGIFYDFTQELGHRLSLKIEWVQESGWGTFINDLKTDRFDMLCSAIWPNAARAREAESLTPLYYSAINAWVSANDTRFDKTLSTMNKSDIKIATIDGETASVIARTDFPNAQALSLPELSSVSDMALSVSAGKADVTFLEAYTAQQFLQNNPGTLKKAGNPVRAFGNSMFIKKDEDAFRSMINMASEEILNSGFLESLYKKIRHYNEVILAKKSPLFTRLK